MKKGEKKSLTKQGGFDILSPVAARATAAVLENDIVKRQKRKNSQISERDNEAEVSWR